MTSLAGVDELAGVVLAGGRSARMGRPKSGLEWHGATLLVGTAAVVARAMTDPVVVVRATSVQPDDAALLADPAVAAPGP